LSKELLAMAPPIPGYYRSLLEIQDGFCLMPDQTRRLPAVLEHLIKPDRLERLTTEISQITPKELEARLGLLEPCFEGIRGLDEHLVEIFARYFPEDSPLNNCSDVVKMSAAAAIIQAFPYEGLASFNPTIVAHPDQEGVEPGALRVVLALRSYGEYHRSSISFRTGAIDEKGSLHLEEAEKTRSGITITQLPAIDGARLTFPQSADPGSFVLYGPFVSDIGETWEDVRFTRFEDEGDHEGLYFGTFTSFNFPKRRLLPCVIVTKDFRVFEYKTLHGAGAGDKDIAYFPKRINGRYAALSRNNGQDIFLMTSEDPFSFKKTKCIAQCRPGSFDAHKMGVCAPPIETPEGWLVIYHGVADPGQIYSLSAMLLDLDDPSRVIARLPYTLHHPLADERRGMLSNINYTCGAILHEASGNLVMPYACNDTFCKVGRIGLDELLARLKDDGPCSPLQNNNHSNNNNKG
jgi:predicted GH43/DUF377 family glycosyl hydrolase